MLWACCLLPIAAIAQSDTLTIHFDFNSSKITAKAAANLDKIANGIENRFFKIYALYGHCDFIGSDDFNETLSQARINAVKKYLIDKRIPAADFKEEMALGETKPARPGKSGKDRAFNRRVELVFDIMTAGNVIIAPSLTEKIKDSAVSSNLVLENLNFFGGRHILVPESEPILLDLVKALANNPAVTIEIQGYVCCTDCEADGLDLDLQTQDLSVQRAKAIYTQLIERGIDAKRLSYRGFGGSKKVFPEEVDEYQKSKNRRVEIKILSK